MFHCGASENEAHFGSKAKLPQNDQDVLEIGDDPDLYLSDIDDPPDKGKRLNSIIVKPIKRIGNQFKRAASFERTREKTRSNNNNRSKNSRFEAVQQARGRNVVPQNQNSHNNKTSELRHAVVKKTFETRGTQTERTGPCKCSRATQAKNQRRRLDNKKNKRLIEALVTHHV